MKSFSPRAKESCTRNMVSYGELDGYLHAVHGAGPRGEYIQPGKINVKKKKKKRKDRITA